MTMLNYLFDRPHGYVSTILILVMDMLHCYLKGFFSYQFVERPTSEKWLSEYI